MVRDRECVNLVIMHMKQGAVKERLDFYIVEKIYRTIINSFINKEQREFREESR